jgi:hypothetical protein
MSIPLNHGFPFTTFTLRIRRTHGALLLKG